MNDNNNNNRYALALLHILNESVAVSLHYPLACIQSNNWHLEFFKWLHAYTVSYNFFFNTTNINDMIVT